MEIDYKLLTIESKHFLLDCVSEHPIERIYQVEPGTRFHEDKGIYNRNRSFIGLLQAKVDHICVV